MSVSNSTDSLRDQLIALRTSRVRNTYIFAWMVLGIITAFVLGGFSFPGAVSTATMLTYVALLTVLWAIVFAVESHVEQRNGRHKDVVRAVVTETTVTFFLPTVIAIIACNAIIKIVPKGVLSYLLGILLYIPVVMTSISLEGFMKARHDRRFLKR